MSKLYMEYLKKKNKDKEKYYLFKSGMFYIFIDEDVYDNNSEQWLKDNVDALSNNSNVLTDMLTPPKVRYEFTLNLPEKSLSNNATDVSDDGKTLTWEFDNIMSGTNNINFTFELYNKQALIVLYVFIGLAGLIALSLIVKIFSWIGDASNKLIKSFYEKAQKDLE